MADNYTIIDHETGEAVESSKFDGVTDVALPGREEPLAALVKASLLGRGELPIHIKMAVEHNIPTRIVSTYIGVPNESVSLHLDKPLQILGACVYFSGVFKSKNTGEFEPGYYKVLLKTNIIKQRDVKGAPPVSYNLIVSTSGAQVASQVLGWVTTNEWYDFKDGFAPWVVFTQEGSGTPHLMLEIDPPKSSK